MNIKQSIIFAVLLISAATLFLTNSLSKTEYGTNNVTDTTVNATELLAEFAGAYPDEATPTGTTVEVDLVAQESSIELIPGYETTTWSYNDSTPAPEIRMKIGDELKINLENQLNEETTIHFHGIRVPNEMDGVPDLTQEPIQPGATFTYQFIPKDAGTYWFHPHFDSAEQMEMGLYGTIIVEDQYSDLYTQDQVWVIDDWLLQNDAQISKNFVTPHDLMHDGRWGNIVTVNSSLQEELIVQPGERIRLRFINSSNARIYELDFGKLETQAIAVDGLYTKESFDPNGFELSPGNRIDLDITIPLDTQGQRFTVYDSFTRDNIPLGTIVVEGEAVGTPNFAAPTNPNIPDWKVADNPANIIYELDAQGMMMNIKWGINGQIYPNISAEELEIGEFQKIKFVNSSTRLHPMHIHGQFFKVISRNGTAVDEPYFRDTVLIHPNETVEIGMVATDKGSWANHCHILEHADSGMMTVIDIH